MSVREKVCRCCKALTFLDDTECKTCGQSFTQRFDARARALSGGPQPIRRPGSRFVLPVLLVVSAVWFGARLGPQALRQGKPLPGRLRAVETSTAAAGVAAKGFVREVARRPPDAIGEAILSPTITIIKTEQSATDPAVWEATGTGTVPMKGRDLQRIMNNFLLSVPDRVPCWEAVA